MNDPALALAGRRERELLDIPSVAHMAAVIGERCRDSSWIRTLVASLDRFRRLTGHDDLEVLLSRARTRATIGDRALLDFALALDGYPDAAVAGLAIGPKVWFRLSGVDVVWRPLPAASAAYTIPDGAVSDPAQRVLVLAPIGSGLHLAELLRLKVGDLGSLGENARLIPDPEAEPFAVRFVPRVGPASERITFLTYAARTAVIEHLRRRTRDGLPVDAASPLVTGSNGRPPSRTAIARARGRANAIIRAGSQLNVDMCRTTGEFFREWGLPGSRFSPTDTLPAATDADTDIDTDADTDIDTRHRHRRRRAPMKAVRLHKYDERPEVGEVDDPKIEGALDVIIRIGGAGVCRTDLHIIEAQWADKTNVKLPYTIGHENAGWVEEVGSAVTNVAPGDTVILHPFVSCGLCLACRAGDDMHCDFGRFPGIDSDGGMADYLLTSARSCVRLDPSLQPADVAALADAGLTAYHAAKKAVPLLYPGTKVVVIGAGGLGHIGIQSLEALTAAEIIVVDRNPEALELARTLGADRTVVADGSQVQEVMDLTDGKGAQVVMDFVAEAGAEAEGWRMTRRAGSHFIVGYGGTINVPTIDVISTERNIIGNLVGTYNDLAELMVLAAQGRVTLHTQTYPLEAVNDAMDDLEAGRLRGRGILVP